MSYSPTELREMSEHLLDVARRLGPEGEGMEVDEDFTLDELVQLRSFLSQTRRGIDLVNKALAVYWHENFNGQQHQTEYDDWYVAQRKGKRFIEDSGFFEWLTTLDAERLSKLISPSAVKVSGMSPVERETFLDETPTTDTLAIQNRPRR
jgi:hypothetical protein